MSILATKIYVENGKTYRIHAQGGLHYIKSNSSPYFSLTGDIKEQTRGGWREDCGGQIHNEILKHFPHLADLAALHLSNIDGTPMYAVENGFYHLGGTHWEKFKVDVVARHFRITEAEAEALSKDLNVAYDKNDTKTMREAKKARVAEYVKSQMKRFNDEASKCIETHKLEVFGDAWKAA